MKIYTKTGDEGTTSLYDGSRINKHDIIFDVLGENDELNARVGKLWCLIEEKLFNYDDNLFVEYIRNIQSCIEIINSNIANPELKEENNNKKRKSCTQITDEMIKSLETKIDDMEKYLPKLTKFILPGVTIADCQSHLCRTQSRKCERMICNLNQTYILDKNILIYMNRLSDFFFVLSRFICNILGYTDFFKDTLLNN